MKLRYVGPHDAVDVDGLGTVKRGATVTATGRVATSLGAQADWKRVADPKPRKPKPKPATGTNGPAAENKEE